MTPLVAVTGEPLDIGALTAAILGVGEGRHGAVATFVGLVRSRNKNRQVLRLEYEAYVPLAVRALEQVRQEVASHWPEVAIGLHHRVGVLAIGDASVLIVAASPHRSDAFAACRFAIERVKQTAPIWKREHFDGGDEWIEGATAEPGDPLALAEALKRSCR